VIVEAEPVSLVRPHPIRYPVRYVHHADKLLGPELKSGVWVGITLSKDNT